MRESDRKPPRVGRDALTAAVERYFRAYFRHSTAADRDSLFALLNTLHSLNDKLVGALGRDLHGSAPFTVLRKLRNLFHHRDELIHEIRLVRVEDVPDLIGDLAVVCLVPRALILKSLDREKNPAVRKSVVATLRWYGDVADIEPCVFNAAVDVYETVTEAGLELAAPEFDAFRKSYERETRQGLDHRIAGLISCKAGDAGLVVERLFRRPMDY
jgi:hypothetical protein